MPNSEFEIWNFSNKPVYIPVSGHKTPMIIYPNRGINTTDTKEMKAAQEYGKPIGVKELTDEIDDTDETPVEPDV